MHSHMIQRMVFELSMAGSENDLESEKKANEYHRKIIVPAVEECFRDIDTPEQQLIINSLDIDLGVFTPESFEKEAKSRLIKHLGKQVREAGGYKTEQKYSDREYWSSSENNIELLRPSNTEDPKRRPADRLALHYLAFTFFLDRGRFPWWFVIDHQKKNNEDIKEQFGPDWIRSLGTPEKSDLKRRLLQAGRNRIRLITVFNAEWIGELLHQIGMEGKEALTLWTFISPALQRFSQIFPVFRQHYWTSWIMAADRDNQYPDMKGILEKTTRGNKQLLWEVSSEIYKIYKTDDHSGFSDRVILALKTLENTGISREEQDPIDLTTPDEHHVEKEPDSPEKDQWQQADIPSESSSESETDELSVGNGISENADMLQEQLQVDADHEEESIFIQAAGLVLLHPFLSELFEQTVLWDGESWLSDEAQLRAVRLLSYLTYGDVDVPEYRLLLHKILAGLELETVLQAVPALAPNELSACDELLNAVIHHWKALRSTSPDGLREGFLLREGKLTPSDKGYRLHIEKRTEDILLSHLPWGYSMVQLPWMNGLLNVSWV